MRSGCLLVRHGPCAVAEMRVRCGAARRCAPRLLRRHAVDSERVRPGPGNWLSGDAGHVPTSQSTLLPRWSAVVGGQSVCLTHSADLTLEFTFSEKRLPWVHVMKRLSRQHLTDMISSYGTDTDGQSECRRDCRTCDVTDGTETEHHWNYVRTFETC
jgi:hypothetical protein